MKKFGIYTVLLAAALLVPTQTTQLGKMKPVEIVCIYRENDTVVIETDTKDVGRGESVAQALQNLKETTSGLIYLDTAEYLLVRKGAESEVAEIAGYLSESVRICNASRNINLEAAASYLAVHKPENRLKDYQSDSNLEMLRMEKDRLILVRK